METIKIPEPVVVEPVHPTTVVTTLNKQLVIEPKTTAEEDRKTKGQRDVNLIWEFTQAMIAIMITTAIIYAAIFSKSSELLSTAFGMIVGMYFQRTNHTKIGGVGGTDSR